MFCLKKKVIQVQNYIRVSKLWQFSFLVNYPVNKIQTFHKVPTLTDNNAFLAVNTHHSVLPMFLYWMNTNCLKLWLAHFFLHCQYLTFMDYITVNCPSNVIAI